MKLRDAQIKKLALKIYSKLDENHLIELSSSSETVLRRIEALIAADARKEDEIEKQARALLDKFRPQIEAGQIDAHEMYLKIRNQLMKDQKFVK